MLSALLAMLAGLVDGYGHGPASAFPWMAGKVPRLPVDRLQIALEAGILRPIGTATGGSLTGGSLTSIIVVACPPS